MNIPQALMRAYDHVDCGVYAEAVTGRLAVGMSSFPPDHGWRLAVMLA